MSRPCRPRWLRDRTRISPSPTSGLGHCEMGRQVAEQAVVKVA